MPLMKLIFIVTSLPKTNTKGLETGKSQLTPFPFQGKIIDRKYAMVSIDGFLGVDSTSSDNYADSLQNANY
jgi:hypothetical protein